MPQAPAPPIAPPAGAPCQTPASQHPARSAQRYASLQMLRAVAAYAVLLFHLGLFRLGYAGVDVFFVLSGFIMGMLGTQEGARAFLLRRLIRIAPLYWAVTLAFCAITAVPGMARHFVLHGADLLRSLLFVPYVNAQGEIWPIVVPGWTLDYEILFYALMGLCLAGCRRAAPQVLVAVLLALVAAGALLQPAAAPAQVLTGPLLLEFLFGLLLCASRPLWGRWEGLVALVLGLAAFAFWAARGEADFTGFHRIATLGLASALLVGGAIGPPVTSSATSSSQNSGLPFSTDEQLVQM